MVTLQVTLADSCLHLVIKNTGKGIKEEEKSQVFNRFKVLDRLEDQILSGVATRTGIGLALCKTLVDLMKGSIKIDSKLDEYTAFILQFPILEKSVPHPNKEEDSLNRSNVESLLARQSAEKEEIKISLHDDFNTILVVDDDDEIRMLLSDILQEQYNILVASNGIEALDILKKRIPDLIICDIIMPAMNGFELIEKLRTRNSPHIYRLSYCLLMLR